MEILIILGAAFILLILLAAKSSKKRMAQINQRAIEAKRLQAKQFAARNIQIIEESKDIINKSKNLNIIASRFDVIQDNLDRLQALADQYNFPDIVTPPPHKAKAYYLEEKERFIGNFIKEQVDFEIEKAKTITRKTTKITILDKALLSILEGKKFLNNENTKSDLDKKLEEVKALISHIKEAEE